MIDLLPRHWLFHYLKFADNAWNVYGDVYVSTFLDQTLGIVSSPNLGSRLGRVTTSVSEVTTRMHAAKGGSFLCAVASVVDLPELECS